MRNGLCKCGHDRSAHEHYRGGTDCALCECNRFRGPDPLRAAWQWITSFGKGDGTTS